MLASTRYSTLAHSRHSVNIKGMSEQFWLCPLKPHKINPKNISATAEGYLSTIFFDLYSELCVPINSTKKSMYKILEVNTSLDIQKSLIEIPIGRNCHTS